MTPRTWRDDARIIREVYQVGRPVTEEEVREEIASLIAKGRRGSLDDRQEHLFAALDLAKRYPVGKYASNPALVIYGNPPIARARMRRYDPGAAIQIVEEVSVEVHYLGYKHRGDGKLYEHKFELPTSMLAVLRHDRHDVLLSSPDGNPIWQEF
jgi:hypothetical protein